MSLLHLEDVTLGYDGAPVLSGVNFKLNAGDRVAILGRSGVGKSTLLAALYEKLTVTSERIALVPQDLALVPQLSVVKNTLMGRLDDHGALHNLKNLLWIAKQERSDTLAVLEPLEMSEHADRAVEALSGGQKQRTALARAFYRGGDVLIGDELFSALDDTQGRALATEAASRFETLVFALHDVALARAMATRILGLADGRIAIDVPIGAVSDKDLDALHSA